MKRILVALLLLLQSTAYADITNPLNIREEDGSPDTYPYQLKVTNGTLTDNGDGTASLQTGGGGGTPGGADTQIQFNDSSSFGGDASLKYLKTTNTVVISADQSQGGNVHALSVSSDFGQVVANISHDGSIFGNKLQLSNDLAVLDGGTGLSGGTSGGVPYYNTATSMASSLLFAANAVVVGGGAGTAPFTITADSTAGHVLVSTATSPNFRQLLTQDVSGTQSVASGGTGITSGTANALPYFVNTGLMGSLTADTTAGHALMSTTSSPAFRQLGTSDISGLGTIATQNSNNVSISGGTITGITDLAVADGGTGLSSGTSGGVLAYTASGTLASSAALTSNAVVIGGGAGVVPSTITADTATTGHFLASRNGSPAFRQILSTDIVGTFPSVSTTPGGSSLQFQINNANTFGGVPLVTADTTRSRLAIGPGTSTLVSLDVAGSMRSVPFALTDASSIAIDLSRSNMFTVTLMGQPRTLANFTNGSPGQKFIVYVSQDATGSRKMGFGTNYAFGSSITSYDATTTAGKHDWIGFIVNQNGVSADVVAVSQGYR